MGITRLQIGLDQSHESVCQINCNNNVWHARSLGSLPGVLGRAKNHTAGMISTKGDRPPQHCDGKHQFGTCLTLTVPHV